MACVRSWSVWILSLAAFAGLLWGLQVLHESNRQRAESEDEERPVLHPGRVELSPDRIGTAGLKPEKAVLLDWSPPVKAWGYLRADPEATAEVRFPHAGLLLVPEGKGPHLGARVKAGEILAFLRPRLGLAESLDLRTRSADAALKEKQEARFLALQEDRLARLEKAAKVGQFVSQKELDELRLGVLETRHRMEAAAARADLLRKILADVEGKGAAEEIPLRAPCEGSIVELAALPGSQQESGALLCRITDAARLLARLDFPPTSAGEAPPATLPLRLLPLRPGGKSETVSPVSAVRIAPAPDVPQGSPFPTWLYRVRLPDDDVSLHAQWRPGRYIQATYDRESSPRRKVVVIPVDALLVHQGEFQVYVEQGPGRYQRRVVRLLAQEGGKAYLAAGVGPDEKVVVGNPQTLLAEEFRGGVEEDD